MIKHLSFLALFLVSSASFGSDTFTVMTGSDQKAPKQPQACVDANGLAHVTYGAGEDVYYCRITENEEVVTKSAFRVPNLSLGMRRGPRIAISGNTIVITAIGGVFGKGRDGDVLAFRSNDGGASWLGPSKVNDTADSAREGLHAMKASSDGTLWCVWLDLREKGTQLFLSKSTDQGASWDANRLVYRSPDGSVCECCHPSIVAAENSLYVLFRNSLQGNRDIYLVASHDGGTTFGDAVRLGQSNWKLNACPMDGGMLAIDKNQNVFTVWRRDRSILSSSAKPNSESLLGTGDQPWVANSQEGYFFVWTSKRDGELYLMKPDKSEAERLSDNASYPVIVAAIQRPSSVFAFWEKRSGNSISITGKRIK